MEKTGVLVVGSGFMGAGIAQVAAQAGFTVTLMDEDSQALARGVDRIKSSIEKLARKGKLNDAPSSVIARINATSELRTDENIRWVIEAVFEDARVKEPLFRALDEMFAADVVLASNTSGIPITQIASWTARAERVIGLHFFGPVPLMALVEVIGGERTSQEVVNASLEFVRALGKTPLVVRADIPGFVVNRILGAALDEAIRLVEWGIASPEEVDNGMKLGLNWGAGPLEIADNAGLDTVLRATVAQFRLNPTPQRAPSELLRRLVETGRLGRKTGEGFYRYDEWGRRAGFSDPVNECLKRKPFADFRF
ncbi:MAG TPA: 3-hydroxyacyl-CoA dehydrogenase family protein [Blastocatellia bacterium]|nr:3-hydroxyacyl-CoA dehydrogenase family protein [Blastocatellia bacterium]